MSPGGSAAAPGTARLYWEVGRRALQRQLAYRTANLAGLVTNVFFGYVRGAVFVAVFAAQPTIAGYDAQAAITYTWLTQALLMVVALWGWWEVEETIRTGDVVSDLAKPLSYLGFWLARDLGRATYFVAFRCAPVLIAGQVLFGLRWPASPLTWLAFAVSVVLAVIVSFGIRFLLNVSAFWTTDARGLGTLALAAVVFLGGFVVPIRFFPSGLQPLLLMLPFAAMTQTPSDIFVERVAGRGILEVLALQTLWAMALLAAAQALLRVAIRRVVTQGG